MQTYPWKILAIMFAFTGFNLGLSWWKSELALTSVGAQRIQLKWLEARVDAMEKNQERTNTSISDRLQEISKKL